MIPLLYLLSTIGRFAQVAGHLFRLLHSLLIGITLDQSLSNPQPSLSARQFSIAQERHQRAQTGPVLHQPPVFLCPGPSLAYLTIQGFATIMPAAAQEQKSPEFVETTHNEPGTITGKHSDQHAERKTLARCPERVVRSAGRCLEVPVDGYIIDIVRGDLLVEIQTRSFSSLKKKLAVLTDSHPVRLVHPIAQEKWIVKLAGDWAKPMSRRKSPKRGHVEDIFAELVSFPRLAGQPAFQPRSAAGPRR